MLGPTGAPTNGEPTTHQFVVTPVKRRGRWYLAICQGTERLKNPGFATQAEAQAECDRRNERLRRVHGG